MKRILTLAEARAPSLALLCKLGSIAGHVEEFLSPAGHTFDRIALLSLLDDGDVKTWMRSMRKHALIPQPRS